LAKPHKPTAINPPQQIVSVKPRVPCINLLSAEAPEVEELLLKINEIHICFRNAANIEHFGNKIKQWWLNLCFILFFAVIA